MSFATVGFGYGVFSVACASLIAPPLWEFLTNENLKDFTSLSAPTLVNIILLNAMGTLNSFSSRISRDYHLHFGYELSTSRLLLLELLRLGGFFLSRALLLKNAAVFTAPLCFYAPKPSIALSALYTVLVVWVFFRTLPEYTIISSRSFTFPKITAHMISIIFQVRQEVFREKNGADIIKLRPQAEPATGTQYQYQALATPRTIRLLRIDCREKTASCTLATVELDNPPDFWALSYLWGSEEKPQSLCITGDSGSDAGHIPITTNCAAAIQALMPRGVRYLWIDAVCINQVDDREKEEQVPLMGQIYSQASLVVGHLYTQSILSVTTLLHRMIQSLADGKEFATDSGGRPEIYRTLSDILNHQYFQRAWIMQEIVLAKSLLLIHGKDCISLDHLITISKAQKGDVQPEGSDSGLLERWIRRMPNHKDDWKLKEWTQFILFRSEFQERAAIIEKLRLSIRGENNSHRLSIAQIVDDNSLLQAKYPRDQVYALLGLASDSTILELQPNYIRSDADNFATSDKEIFTKISCHYLQVGQLNLFLSAGLSPKWFEQPRTPGLPSWVYDFSNGPAQEGRVGNWAVDIERTRSTHLKCKMSSEYLSVRGTIIAKVAFVASQAIKPEDISGKSVSDLATITMHLLQDKMYPLMDETRGLVTKYVPDPYPGGIKRQEAYWRTMIMDRFCDQTPAPPEAEDFLFSVSDMYQQMKASSGPLNPSKLERGRTNEQVVASINSLITRMTRVWMPNTFVILESGYMGWSPHGVNVGDVYCMLDGCVVPFVLCPTAGADTFSLLGTGYIHGIMPDQQPGVEETSREWIKIV